MEEENDALEVRERLEELQERRQGWTRYLALTTAIIAVLAAIASLVSGNLANEALMEKNGAVLLQSQASDQWTYYQAKGVKKNIAEAFAGSGRNPKLAEESERYAQEQQAIKSRAEDFESRCRAANERAEIFLHRHHRVALAVTFSQVAIAMSAIAALLMRKSFWYLSIVLAFAACLFAAAGAFP